VRSATTNRQSIRVILAALLPAVAGCGSPTERTLEETFERLYTIEPNVNVTIHNGDGAVLVYGSNINEMQVHAVKKAYSRMRLTQIATDVSVKPGSVSITTKFPPKPKWALFDRSGTVDYTIVVPATATISELNLDAGEILLDGMRGPTTRARLGEGRIFTRNCFSKLDLAVRRGNVIVSFDWWEESTFSVEASIVQGNVSAYIPDDAAFHLLATATRGKIASDFNGITIAEPSSAAGMKIDTLVDSGGEATIKIGVAEGNIQIVEANQ
jgi:hypothetical protein